MSESSHPLLELVGVSKEYQEGDHLRPILQDADLRIDAGQVVALLGRSGSGKSTLLNVVSGIDLPSSGRVLVDGTDLGALDERQRTLWRRHGVGFIFQFFHLIPTLTVAENVLFPLDLLGRRGGDDEARALDLLRQLGLGDRLQSFPDVLSGGEQQRIAIVRALAHDPPLILADEPTGNLDEETAEQVLDLLLDGVRRRQKTLLMVTHSRQVAARADRILHLRHGRFEEETLPVGPRGVPETAG